MDMNVDAGRTVLLESGPQAGMYAIEVRGMVYLTPEEYRNMDAGMGHVQMILRKKRNAPGIDTTDGSGTPA